MVYGSQRPWIRLASDLVGGTDRCEADQLLGCCLIRNVSERRPHS
jgi:hypothetical protein